MFRRIKSAPADLSMMSYSVKDKVVNSTFLSLHPESESKQIVLSEVMDNITNDVQISDPTQQLILLNVVRFIIRWENWGGVNTILWTFAQRIFASVVSHKIMIGLLGLLHNSNAYIFLHNFEQIVHCSLILFILEIL